MQNFQDDASLVKLGIQCVSFLAAHRARTRTPAMAGGSEMLAIPVRTQYDFVWVAKRVSVQLLCRLIEDQC